MAISSNCLFHFTAKIEYLEDILKNGFWPRYCIEYGWGNQYIDFALPMVCFCDIPLTWIFEHANFYGQYGIGVSKQWIRLNKYITPVQYVSTTAEEFYRIKKLLTKLKNKDITQSEIHKLFLAKKVSGKAIRKDGKKITKKFYDEREWRYIPPELNITDCLIPVWKRKSVDLEGSSKRTNSLRLKISIHDVKYLIIPNEAYRRKMIDMIKKIYENETQVCIDNLISRIITLKQIEEDF